MNDIIINSIILHKITQFQSRIQQQPLHSHIPIFTATREKERKKASTTTTTQRWKKRKLLMYDDDEDHDDEYAYPD